jgi:hypothetical protein
LIFEAANYNIDQATILSESFVTKSYGSVIDDSLKPMLTQFSNMLNSFSSNVTEISYLMGGLARTVESIQSITEGFALFNQSYQDARAVASDGAEFFTLINADPRFNRSEVLMTYSRDNGSAGWTAIEAATLIAGSVKSTWQDSLYYQGPPLFDHSTLNINSSEGFLSIAGLAHGILDKISLFRSVWTLLEYDQYSALVQTFFEYMDTVPLDEIF